MSAPWNPPKRGEDFEFSTTLEDMNSPGSFKANPTIAAGDFKISKDEGAFANLATLPTVTPAGGVQVIVKISATENTADKWLVTWIDQTAPKEWADGSLGLLTTA